MKQFVVIGMGRFGASIARTLYTLGQDVLAIDKDAEAVEQISDHVTQAVQADATDETTLHALGLADFDVAIVNTAGDLQASILICLLCKEMGIGQVIAKAQSDLHARVLLKIGVDRVVFPERDVGMRLAHNLVSTSVLDFIELSPHYNLAEINTQARWVGKTLKDLNMRAAYGVNVMAIRHGDDIIVSPQGDDALFEGDVLVVIGSSESINRLERPQA